MKKIIGILFALLLASVSAFSMIGCGTKNSDSGDVAPISFKYTLEKEETKDENETAETYYVLSGVTVSDKAKTLIEKNDYEGLAELFNTAVEGVYEAPAVKYTKETVRKLTIPETYEGKAVKKIAADAVVDLTFIEEIEVKSNIEEFGLGSFSGLTSLKTITLPFAGKKLGAKNSEKSFGYIFGTTSSDGLTSCAQTYNEGSSDNSATYYIPSSLKTVTITGDNKVSFETKKYILEKDEDGKDKIVYVDDSYTGESTVYSITLDTSVYAVAPYSFYNVSMAETVTLSGNIDEIGADTFYGCSSLKTITLGGAKKIGSAAFQGCTSLKKIDLSEVATIGDNAFNGCTSLGVLEDYGANNALTLVATEIGESAFAGCTSLDSVTFSVKTSIGDNAFKGCTALRNVTFSAADTTIGKFAFSSCTKRLTAIDLANVSDVGEGAFYGCSVLETISNQPAKIGANAFKNTKWEENQEKA